MRVVMLALVMLGCTNESRPPAPLLQEDCPRVVDELTLKLKQCRLQTRMRGISPSTLCKELPVADVRELASLSCDALDERLPPMR